MGQVKVIGAGLAGAEAAWQLAQRGIQVELMEMRPQRMTPAHHTGLFAELVCSNSLRSNGLENAVGLLKEEMRRLDSLIMACADQHQVPAGGALAVDRQGFAQAVTERLTAHSNVTVRSVEVEEIPTNQVVVVASGPLTSDTLAQDITRFIGEDYLYFYDAAAPIVSLDSLDQNKIFRASRYGRGEDDYLNCPMNQEEYQYFYQALITAERAELKEFEKEVHFEGCMPVEAMASRGEQTLLFGPLKPVGLVDPRTDREPHAVVQLRQDNAEGTLYNLVGFQTNLKWSEQKRVFGMIPGLEQAEFVRYGVMHRNTYINSPKVLQPTNQLRTNSQVLFAGQITGVEGYIESAASGLIAGINAGRLVEDKETIIFPVTTALGGLLNYITSSEAKKFQPMNMTFGLLPPLEGKKIRDKKLKNRTIAERALVDLEAFIKENQLIP